MLQKLKNYGVEVKENIINICSSYNASYFSKFKSSTDLKNYLRDVHFKDDQIYATTCPHKMIELYNEAISYFKISDNYSKNPNLYIDLAISLFKLTNDDILNYIAAPKHPIYNTIQILLIELLHVTNYDPKICNIITESLCTLDPKEFLKKCTNSADALSYFNAYTNESSFTDRDDAFNSFLYTSIYTNLSYDIKECIFECLYDSKDIFSGDPIEYIDNVFDLFSKLDLEKINLHSDFKYKVLSMMCMFETNLKDTHLFYELAPFIAECKEYGNVWYGPKFESIYNMATSLGCAHDINFWKSADRSHIHHLSINESVLPELV